MIRGRIERVLALLIVTTVFAACGGSTPQAPSLTPSAGTRVEAWAVLVRSGGPRWLAPSWWRGQGYDVASSQPPDFALTHRGEPVPALWVEAPDGWGMLFHAQKGTTALGPATGFVLTMEGSGEPARLGPAAGVSAEACQTTSAAQITYGPDKVFRSTTPVEPPWLWQSLRPPEGVTVTLTLTNNVPGQPAELRVTAWGQSSMPQDPDHHLRVVWNGVALADRFWDGDQLETWVVQVPSVEAAANTVELVAPGGTDAAVELTWLDELEVTWRQALVLADGAWLRWQADRAKTACFETPDGVNADSFVAILVGSGEDVRYLHPTAYGEAAGIVVSQRPGETGWIGVPWEAPAPDIVRPREVVDRKGLQQSAYLVVAPAAYQDAIAPLVAAREGEGLSTTLMSPEAVYDTYGTGLPEAAALQRMVRDVATQGLARFVLVVGDASADVDLAWEAGASYVPTGWVRTYHVGATPSDFALATGGTDAPLVAFGRLPVATVRDLEAVVRKTLAWVPTARLLLVRDDEPAFETLTDQLAASGSGDPATDAVAEVTAASSGARGTVLSWLRKGPGTLVYAGHGSLRLLGDEKLLLAEDGPALVGPTAIAAWTCLCANYAHPDYASLAEAWLLAPKGAVAMVGPTGETTTAQQTAMALTFQEALQSGESIGVALKAAWSSATSDDARHGFVLLGDPALRPMPGGGAGDGDG